MGALANGDAGPMRSHRLGSWTHFLAGSSLKWHMSAMSGLSY